MRTLWSSALEVDAGVDPAVFLRRMSYVVKLPDETLEVLKACEATTDPLYQERWPDIVRQVINDDNFRQGGELVDRIDGAAMTALNFCAVTLERVVPSQPSDETLDRWRAELADIRDEIEASDDLELSVRSQLSQQLSAVCAALGSYHHGGACVLSSEIESTLGSILIKSRHPKALAAFQCLIEIAVKMGPTVARLAPSITKLLGDGSAE